MEQHIASLIPDYVLDLLPQRDRLKVESHVLRCHECRRALEEERALDSLIRQTLQVATQPSFGLLQRSRPLIGPRREPIQAALIRQLAPAMLLLAILAGTLVMQSAQISRRFDLTAPVFYRTNTPTATSTSTPTATLSGRPFEIPATAISMTGKTMGNVAPVVPQAQQLAAATTEIRPMPTPLVTANAPATR